MSVIHSHKTSVDVLGPWSLATSKKFWEGFAPSSLAPQNDAVLRTVFCCEGDWNRVEAQVRQSGHTAHITVTGVGDLDAAAAQVGRFLSLDIDARDWPKVADRDPIIAEAQTQLRGLRPCGFHSPYEAAAWAVLSGRIRIVQAARLRADLITQHGEDGAFPTPHALLDLDLDLPGRKPEYLRAVAEAALDGHLAAEQLRAMEPGHAISTIQQVKGLGPFGAELVLIRGANAPDVLPHHERRLNAEITERYGPNHDLTEVTQAWRPFRSWATVHLRTLREERTHEIVPSAAEG